MKIAAFYENIIYAAERERISVEEVLDDLISEGLQMIYISWDSLKGKEEELINLFRQKNLPIEGLHQHFDFGHHPEDESYKEYIDIAQRIGASNCLIVPGMILEEEQENRESIIENMICVVEKAVEYGNTKGITVCMEDFDSMNAPYNSIRGLSAFLDRVPGLMCAFDTGNFVCYKEDEKAAFDKFAGKICTVHLKDRNSFANLKGDTACICSDNSSAWPAPVGGGYIQIKEILERLEEKNYKGNVIIEMYCYEDALNGIKQSLRWLRRKLQR